MTDYHELTVNNLLAVTNQLDNETLLFYCQTNKAIANFCTHKL